MSHTLFGQVVGVRKFTNGDIEVDFHHEEIITEFRYSSDSSRLGNFPKELIETLASTLATDICIEIFFEDGNPTHIELEECDDDLDDEEDDLDDEEISQEE
ncbi:MAG: hypothetical protein HOK63_06090 [Thaumarchaeota archaeon]|nr:hypothetical protein [Nitrososphaerota archaeon]MBT5842341.1 hypothetical protein [Nitrososphaerota archaeon]MBT6469200.1 hypothetical protein [Nitrososphaerota archaeon]